ncbi:hypothetical protein A3A71_02880 [Candidatus Berkelbacteria bacterium RIFCSPLOWO2_01_FULL_50_28]|uniref:Uncharacterized protein n=1 Tax=Candidatus Berkelbacteria bacterium RIFCSPLOWO2_01_FULL_50_28 TaxID=1797471 RepID=A0A1F5ECH6_9BACT|nr:MAG: hypothetical protein A2807_02415 [Candidatus Berkelbacteria bacterium RIFCSPHIGHO2_01_FULL_50_36]OGD62657.1 MAG: hypothetical protein A3F39_00430 [Candidatus Berkelbacteria bacterium RIFCSPHIGHO2_12_FULL_50_11]OGD64966.1 MAG: hypothetical protein A3A71_02880 [Candidatus Berkelbacteria bacterium RIFCSPLOWO2_01_FULL_50_28]
MAKPRDSVIGKDTLQGDIVLAQLNTQIVQQAQRRGLSRGYKLSSPVAYADPKGVDLEDFWLCDVDSREVYQHACQALRTMVIGRTFKRPTANHHLLLRLDSGELRDWHDRLLVKPVVVVGRFVVIGGQFRIVPTQAATSTEATNGLNEGRATAP